MTEARNCGNCGATLRTGVSFCRDCGASVRSVNDGKCPTCGNDNSVGAKFCGKCGTSLSAPIASSIGVGVVELPMVSFIEAIKLGFINYVTFSGRATRAEFWWFYLFSIIGFYGLVFISGALAAVSGSAAFFVIAYMASLLLFTIPIVALSARRLHDTGRSGWRWLLLIVPIGGIFVFVWWCQKGNAGPNKYGPDPRQATSQ